MRAKKWYERSRDTWVYSNERQICRRYDLTTKTKDLARYYGLVRKYRSLARREGKDSRPYELAVKSLTRIGVLLQNKSLEDLKIEDFIKLRLNLLVRQRVGCSLLKARQLIISGKVRYRGRKLQSPSAHIPLGLREFVEVSGIKSTVNANSRNTFD